MTRFDEVARLQELGKRLVALKKRRQDWNSVNYGIMEEISIEQSLHNAAPWLLEAAACFQPGDAEALDSVDACGCDDPYCVRKADALRRLQKAAKIMEGME